MSNNTVIIVLGLVVLLAIGGIAWFAWSTSQRQIAVRDDAGSLIGGGIGDIISGAFNIAGI